MGVGVLLQDQRGEEEEQQRLHQDQEGAGELRHPLREGEEAQVHLLEVREHQEAGEPT